MPCWVEQNSRRGPLQEGLCPQTHALTFLNIRHNPGSSERVFLRMEVRISMATFPAAFPGRQNPWDSVGPRGGPCPPLSCSLSHASMLGMRLRARLLAAECLAEAHSLPSRRGGCKVWQRSALFRDAEMEVVDSKRHPVTDE